MARAIDNTPKADNLMGSLRSMGYSFESAIADIIDNSVSAGAREIHINFPTTALESFVYILDDGHGMTKKEHFNAMRYGSSASESSRDATDLGRFGLGMKSASLSQCRVLTVLTKRGKVISGYSWDYKHILKCKKWEVLELDQHDIDKVKGVDALKAQKSGTLVVWEDFDILEKASGGQIYATLNDYKEKIIKHVGLIFHRFINAPRNQKITFYVNNHKVKGLDPFLENNPKTTRKKEVSVALMDSTGVERLIWVQPFVLPFHKDLTDADIEKLGGVEDMRTKQGYYVYRNNRLIIYGTWFGFPRNELTKNARIRVDIPNTLDDIWKLDVKKQSASIPKAIQNQLNRKVREAMDISVRQQTHRGRKNNVDEKIDYLWNRIEGRDSHFFYEINRESKLFKFVEEQIPEEAKSYVDMLLEELERNVPIQQMYIDQANNSIIAKEADDRENDILQEAIMMINFAKVFKDPKEIIDALMTSQPFCEFEGLKERDKEMTPEAFEAVHNFIRFSMEAQEKMGKHFTEEDLEQEIHKGETFLSINLEKDEYSALKRRLESRFKIKHTLSSIIYNDYEDIPDWYSHFTPVNEYFWNRYRTHLISFEKLPLPSVNLLGEKTLVELMNCLSNPNIEPEKPIFRRGLVIGDVQSGKTATYGGLICKAADAGYKVVILLTGTTESLRKQTQERMEEGIIGFTIRVDKKGTKQKSFNRVGVGLDNEEIRAMAYTSYQDDFVGSSDTLLTTLGSHKNLVMFIVKKNVTVLEKLLNWLVELNKNVLDDLIHVPLLLIDDEADNASINTKNDKSSPTRTNALIRQICTSFNNSTYVGFTATPFANVFIDPDTTEQMTSADLFPEHFIYVLPTPSNYIGAKKIFYPDGENSSMLKFIKDIEEPDVEELKAMEPEERLCRKLYYKHPKEWEGELPDSLTESIYCYMVANAVRDLRGDTKAPRTMMINVSRFVKVQRYLKKQVEDIVNSIHRAVDCDFHENNDKNQYLPVYRKFVEVWIRHFSNLGLDQEFVINKMVLLDAIDKIQVVIVNSDKDSMKLDYKKYPSMRIIAIGGLALSRGLTLKGLMTSYFYRNTSTFDVLMQMGRWFGYRPNYDDLCQIWTSHTSARWYEEITKSTEELKDDIRQMFEEKMTPKEFGIKVRDESDDLQITAYNKMRTSFKRTEYLTFWGNLVETPYASLIPQNNINSYEAVKLLVQRLYSAGYSATRYEGSSSKHKTEVFYDVPIDFISFFLSKIEVSRFNAKFDTKTIQEFLSDNYGGKLGKWDISIQSGSGDEIIDYGHGVTINSAKRDMFVSNNHICFTGRGTLGGPTDGYVGITPKQRDAAKKALEDAKRAAGEKQTKGASNYTWFKYISDRKPLLVIYSIKHSGGDGDDDINKYLREIGDIPVMGFGIGFPANVSADSTQKKYRVNKVFQRQVLESEFEETEEE